MKHVILILCCAALLAGCGLKRDLVLPENDPYVYKDKRKKDAQPDQSDAQPKAP